MAEYGYINSSSVSVSEHKPLYELYDFPQNETIFSNMMKADMIINCRGYKRIICGISGGSDSCVLLDILSKVDRDRKIFYFFVDTGIESAACHEHLDYLEQKYGVTIARIRPKKTVPAVVRSVGVPFHDKEVSCYIRRLQAVDFDFTDPSPFECLVDKYCTRASEEKKEEIEKSGKSGWAKIGDNYYRGCISALKWWCNEKGDDSRFNIGKHKLLKEYITENPPTFKISEKCCDETKKKVLHEVIRTLTKGYASYEVLSISGVRIAEGGARATTFANKGCWSKDTGDYDTYRPIQWYSDADKQEYIDFYGIKLSRLYDTAFNGGYGLSRSGCACCPFGSRFEQELEAFQKNEPGLYKVVSTIFAQSYEYTRNYRLYKNSRKKG